MGRVKEGSASQRINIINISIFLQESHLSQQNRSTPGSHYGCAMEPSPSVGCDTGFVPSSVTHGPSSPPCHLINISLNVSLASRTSQECKQIMEDELLKLLASRGLVSLWFKWNQCLLLMGKSLLGLCNKHLEVFWECQSSWSANFSRFNSE